MTTARETPRTISPGARAARVTYNVLAWFFAAGVVVQVYLAGMGVLVDPGYFGWHTTFAHVIEFILFVMLIAGAIGRVGWTAIGLNLLLLLLFTLQYVFMYGFQGPPRALHVVNALALFWFAVHLGKRSWQLARPAPTSVAVPAGDPSDGPDGSESGSRPAAGGRSAGRVLAGTLLVLVGAAVLYGIIFDDGSGTLNAGSRAPQAQRADGEAEDPAGAGPAAAGEAIFAENCAGCHGRNGQGGFGPELAGNDALEDTAFVVERILDGAGPMPAWGDRLSDEEVAAVAGHIRSNWGNDFGPVAPEDVRARRQGE